jgi:hypothetical protein
VVGLVQILIDAYGLAILGDGLFPIVLCPKCGTEVDVGLCVILLELASFKKLANGLGD